MVINIAGKLVVLDTGNGPVANVNSKGANGQFGANMVLRTIPDAQSHQGMTLLHLDENGARPYSRAMINAATILIARRRRTVAVWVDICV